MKVLTIKQPWAQLIIDGAKDIENRDWPTSVRGRIGVHASAKLDKQEILDACDFMASWIPKFSKRIFTAEALSYPVGAILGTVELVDCLKLPRLAGDSPWFVGEYGFVLRNPQKFETPIPAKGALGFWEWSE